MCHNNSTMTVTILQCNLALFCAVHHKYSYYFSLHKCGKYAQETQKYCTCKGHNREVLLFLRIQDLHKDTVISSWWSQQNKLLNGLYTLKQKIPLKKPVQKPDYNLMNEMEYLILMAGGVSRRPSGPAGVAGMFWSLSHQTCGRSSWLAV